MTKSKKLQTYRKKGYQASQCYHLIISKGQAAKIRQAEIQSFVLDCMQSRAAKAASGRCDRPCGPSATFPKAQGVHGAWDGPPQLDCHDVVSQKETQLPMDAVHDPKGRFPFFTRSWICLFREKIHGFKK